MNSSTAARQSAAAEASRGGRVVPMIVFTVTLLLLLGCVIARSRAEAGELAQLEKQTDAETTRTRKLAAVKAKLDRAQRAKDAFRARVDMIYQLRGNESDTAGPLAALGVAVQHAAEVRIESVEWNVESNHSRQLRLSVRGQTASPQSIDQFKAELERASGFACSSAAAAGAGQASATSFAFDCTPRPPNGAAAQQPGGDHAK